MSIADFHAIYLADPSQDNLGRLLSEVRRISLSEARRLRVNRDDAEDLAQAVMLKVWNQLKADRLITGMSSYVRSATRNQIMNAKRDRNRVKRGGLITGSLSECRERKFSTG